MPKIFFFPNSNMVRADVFPGSLAVFERCGFAACIFCGGFAPPSAARKLVRTNSSILHQVGNCKEELAAAHCVLGLNSNWRFRIREKENFLAFH
ncbi:hypothetical protein EXS62_00930 [Candidatus Kaiserbacteria bacterium]|nr:hypothetical protein [Candidatus Kaiserbacteria bacterium]